MEKVDNLPVRRCPSSNPNMNNLINAFKSSSTGPYCVVGASKDPLKFGNRVLKHYKNLQKHVIAINPKHGGDKIEDVSCFPNLSAVPKEALVRQKCFETVTVAISVITPPPVTLKLVQEVKGLLGHEGPWNRPGDFVVDHVRLWLQPGSESQQVLDEVGSIEDNKVEVIYGGPCVLMQKW